tara:strand:- start:29 stop:262 length:234 start_codon:yes stop_codon:yes gene_type:complete
MSNFKENMNKVVKDLTKKEQLSKQISSLINRSEDEILDKTKKLRLGDYFNLISSVRSSNIKQIEKILDLNNDANRQN